MLAGRHAFERISRNTPANRRINFKPNQIIIWSWLSPSTGLPYYTTFNQQSIEEKDHAPKSRNGKA
jgi:hypothetical protein